MATKRKSRKAIAAPTVQDQLLGVVHQIWLAGLGAASKASHGAPKLLQELVSEGARVQARNRDVAEKAVRGLMTTVQSSISERIGQARSQASDTLENLEKIFQTRVHRALTQLGVPSAEEIEALGKRVDTLNVSINRLAAARRRPHGDGRRTRATPAPAAPTS
jgi:poly(hydroxyalkanoate) granule-associated protein